MGEEIRIDIVENFINEISETEISDISKIIREMISIKNNKTRLIEKKTKPYDIVDKIKLNKFPNTLAEKIKKHHIDSYDIIDDAINCLEEFETCIGEDLYDYYWETYTNILISLKVDIGDENKIKESVELIYINLVEKIKKELFVGKKTDIPLNKIITYIGAITAYVFYKCKFLIPVEKCKY